MTEDNIEKLKKQIYKGNEAFDKRMNRSKLSSEDEEGVKHYWKFDDTKYENIKKPRFHLMKSFIVFSVIFLLVAGGVVAYLLLGGRNVISSRNIDIDIKAPIYIESGKIIDLKILIENKNNTSLKLSNLIIEYPKGSISPENSEAIVSKGRYSLGRIGPNQIVNKSFNFILFGDEQEERKVIITFEYRLEDSNAIFEKKQEHTFIITKPPVGVSISIPKEIRSNQEVNVDVEIVSNSDVLMRDLVLQMEYPPGFRFVSSSIEPSDDENRWIIGDLESSQKRIINIKGIIEGFDLDEKAIHAIVGIADGNNSIVVYGRNSETVTIKKPLFDISILINGKDEEDNIINPGDSIRCVVSLKSNLLYKIHDGVIEVEINSGLIDEKSIFVGNGFYRGFDKKIIWNASSFNKLSIINPGEEEKVQFSFDVINPIEVKSINDKNFNFDLKANFLGTGFSDELGNIEIANNTIKNVKVLSDVQFAGMALYHSGAFENSGPIPPKVGNETTYNIVWSVSNFYNDISNVVVRASLPAYINWLDNIFPENANISFNEVTGEIVWRAGLIPAGTGILRPAKEISFQIGLIPSLNQVNSSPILISGMNLNGHDEFADKDININMNKINTVLINDPQFNDSQGKVIE